MLSAQRVVIFAVLKTFNSSENSDGGKTDDHGNEEASLFTQRFTEITKSKFSLIEKSIDKAFTFETHLIDHDMLNCAKILMF